MDDITTQTNVDNEIESVDGTETAVTPPPPSGTTYKAVQSITRLLVGGALTGSDELLKRLQQLEREITAAEKAEREQRGETAVDPAKTDSDSDRVRYALVGLLFESQNAVRKRLPLMKRIARLGANGAALAMDVVSDNSVGREVNGRLSHAATRGERAVNRWIKRGRQEESTGRQMSLLLTQDVIDEFINNLAENEEIGDLVTQQSMGLAGEVVDTVREQTVTADTLVERVARAILRRPPREDGVHKKNTVPQTTTIDEDGTIIPSAEGE